MAHVRLDNVFAYIFVRDVVRHERGGREDAGHRFQIHHDGVLLAGSDTGVCIRHPAADSFQFYSGTRNQAGRQHLDHHQGNPDGLARSGDSGYELSLIHISEPTRPY